MLVRVSLDELSEGDEVYYPYLWPGDPLLKVQWQLYTDKFGNYPNYRKGIYTSLFFDASDASLVNTIYMELEYIRNKKISLILK
jgi:hypothetical protein